MHMQGIFIPTEEKVRSIVEDLINPKFDELKELITRSINPPKINYTVDEVAKFLNVSKLTVYNYIKNGKIKADKVGRNYNIKSEDLEKSRSEVKSLKYRRAC